MTYCNHVKEPVLCAPCSEWIMDTKINVVKLRGKERHECNRDTYMCSFAPHLSASYITREEQDKRNTADLEASEVRIRRKRALYEPPPVLIKKRATNNKTVRVVKRATHKESRSASKLSGRDDLNENLPSPVTPSSQSNDFLVSQQYSSEHVFDDDDDNDDVPYAPCYS
jgi:hypothetical protein